jgi:hypothetical protein
VPRRFLVGHIWWGTLSALAYGSVTWMPRRFRPWAHPTHAALGTFEPQCEFHPTMIMRDTSGATRRRVADTLSDPLTLGTGLKKNPSWRSVPERGRDALPVRGDALLGHGAVRGEGTQLTLAFVQVDSCGPARGVARPAPSGAPRGATPFPACGVSPSGRRAASRDR